MSQPVDLSAEGPPDTVLPAEDADLHARLAAAGSDPEGLAGVIAEHPASLAAWAALGRATEAAATSAVDVVHAYSAFRVGYHRGLDALRKNGWRGSGYVRWDHESNRGFLSCLAGLGRLAQRIGEHNEHERVEQFLRQLDPAWPPHEDA